MKLIQISIFRFGKLQSRSLKKQDPVHYHYCGCPHGNLEVWARRQIILAPTPCSSITSHANVEKPGSHHLLSIYLLFSYSTYVQENQNWYALPLYSCGKQLYRLQCLSAVPLPLILQTPPFLNLLRLAPFLLHSPSVRLFHTFVTQILLSQSGFFLRFLRPSKYK